MSVRLFNFWLKRDDLYYTNKKWLSQVENYNFRILILFELMFNISHQFNTSLSETCRFCNQIFFCEVKLKRHTPLPKLQGQRLGLWHIPEQGQRHSWLQRMIQYPHLSAQYRKLLSKCNPSENYDSGRKVTCILMLNSMTN